MRSILFDTDPGVDDALALLYLHRHPEVELVGITTVAGNGPIDVVTRNARSLAERFGIDVPIARGAALSLRGEEHLAPPEIHGANALGDVPIAVEPTRAIDPRPAHRFIIDTIRARPGEITICAVAMFTNLARALIEDPEIALLVRDVVIMGGAFGIGGATGNASPVAEANVFCDPHAADAVCSAPWPLTIVGLDVTHRIPMTTAYLEHLRDEGGDDGRFLWDVTRVYQAFYERERGIDGIFAHDPSAAVCAVDDTPFAFRSDPVRVVRDGIAAGMTLQRPAGLRGGEPWTTAPPQRVALDVDADAVLERFASVFIAR